MCKQFRLQTQFQSFPFATGLNPILVMFLWVFFVVVVCIFLYLYPWYQIHASSNKYILKRYGEINSSHSFQKLRTVTSTVIRLDSIKLDFTLIVQRQEQQTV